MDVTVVFSYRSPGKYAFNVLAGALEQADHPGLHLRFARERTEMVQDIVAAADAGHAVLACWSFYSPGLPEAIEELAFVRAGVGARPFVAIAGGVHATAEPQETLDGGFDFAALGEGETTILEAVARLARGEALSGMRGLARLVEGKVESGGKGAMVQLDDYPPFAPKHGRFGAIELTRGCIYACSFCQTPFLNKARFRHRSADLVAKAARQLREAGHRDLRFISPTSLSYGSPGEEVNLPAVDELLGKVREAMGADGRVFFGTFPSEVRPEHVTPEAMAVLKKWVDNDNLIIGGQSGSARVLASTHRGHDVECIERAVRVSVEYGFQPNVDFLLGLPGEAPEDAALTMSLMEKLAGLGARVHTHTFMPLPGTPLKNAPPGKVGEGSRKRLEVLASSGAAYGQWKRQQDVAEALAERRNRRRGS